MDAQLIIVVAIVLGAAVYLGRTLFKSAKGHTCESGKCSHHPTIEKNKSVQTVFKKYILL